MRGWKNRVLAQVHECARQRQVVMTRKAIQELEDLNVSLQPTEISSVVLGLRLTEIVERLRSHRDDDWLYVFNTTIEGVSVYLKLAIQQKCLVISCHEFE